MNSVEMLPYITQCDLQFCFFVRCYYVVELQPTTYLLTNLSNPHVHIDNVMFYIKSPYSLFILHLISFIH